MYFFDIEDLYNSGVCGANMTRTTPTQWEEVRTTFIAVFNQNAKKFNDFYQSKIQSMPSSDCKTQITNLYNNWLSYYTNTLIVKVNAFFEALIDGSFDECNHTEWNNYFNSYKTYLDLQKNIVFLLDTNCEAQAYDFNTCADVTTISDENPVTKKCCGIYVMKFDLGSEFRGTVTDSNGPNNSVNNIVINN